MRTIRLAGLLILLSALLAPSAQAAGPHRDLALGALSWIAAQQRADGGFPGFGAGVTADAVFAICAVGGDPNGFLRNGHSPISYLAAHADEFSATPGVAAKAVLALVCAGHDPRRLAGVDLLAVVEGALDPGSGQYGHDLAGHAFSMLALAAAGRPIPQSAVAWLRAAQTPEGGWTWLGTPLPGEADTNSTALALQALIAAGVTTSDPAIQKALVYLHGQQNADGGFPYAKPSPYGSDTDANSTAYVVQGLLAAGEDPEGPAWTVEGKTPLTALWKLQLPSGALEWQAGYGENALATYQAVPALMLVPFPLAPVAAGEFPALLPVTGPVPAFPAGLFLLGVALLLLGLGLHRAGRFAPSPTR